MANAIQSQSNRFNPQCMVCLDGFSPSQERWTHVGGENHDPFHKLCLKNWLDVNPLCPYRDAYINPHSLTSRTETVFEKAIQFFIDAIGLALFGALIIGALLLTAKIITANTALGITASAAGGILRDC